jgi:protein subunit release factor B
MPERQLLFSVTLDDCTLQHFRAGGNGGQHQNVTDSGTRIIHLPSGARGESREERSQLANKRAAWKRLVAHPAFVFWVHQESRRLEGFESAETRTDRMMADHAQLRTEVKGPDGRWVEVEHDAVLGDSAVVGVTSVQVHGQRKKKVA